jgi:hypothetical protein
MTAYQLPNVPSLRGRGILGRSEREVEKVSVPAEDGAPAENPVEERPPPACASVPACAFTRAAS